MARPGHAPAETLRTGDFSTNRRGTPASWKSDQALRENYFTSNIVGHSRDLGPGTPGRRALRGHSGFGTPVGSRNTLGLGTPWVWAWALQRDSGAGHSGDMVRLSPCGNTLGLGDPASDPATLWVGRALGLGNAGTPRVGHSRDTLGLGTPGMMSEE